MAIPVRGWFRVSLSHVEAVNSLTTCTPHSAKTDLSSVLAYSDKRQGDDAASHLARAAAYMLIDAHSFGHVCMPYQCCHVPAVMWQQGAWTLQSAMQ